MKELRFPFPNSISIDESFGQAGQDLFVLAALEGLTEGTYLEIGAAYPDYTSNTYLLEQKFNWRGVSIDINNDFVVEFNKVRKNKCILADAITIDYTSILNREVYEYLSIDCEPPEHTYKALLNLPLQKIKFATITYEHDAYAGGQRYRELSRKYLTNLGYKLVVSNISESINNKPFEDWWIHSDLVPDSTFSKMLSIDKEYQYWKDYIFNE